MPGIYDSILGTKKALKDAASTGAPTPATRSKVVIPAGINVASEAEKLVAKKKADEIRRRQQLQEAAKKR